MGLAQAAGATRGRRRTARGTWATGAPDARLQAIIFVPIVLLVLASAAFFGLGARSVRPCGPAIQLQNTAPALSRAKTCRPAPQGYVHQRMPSG
jgi:hypothetical protein